MEYSVKGKISFDDYKNFLIAAVFHKIHYLILYIVFCGWLLYMPIKEIIKSPNISTIISEILPIIIIFFGYFLVYNFYLKRTYKSDSMLQEEITIVFSKEGLHWKTENGSYTYKVENFKRFIFTKKIIAIYVSNRKAILIPNHFFNSSEEKKQIEIFIKENYVNLKK